MKLRQRFLLSDSDRQAKGWRRPALLFLLLALPSWAFGQANYATPYTFVTLAGSAALGVGSADGTGSAAQFYNPGGAAVDTNGNVYVADTDNFTIRKITPAGVVTTLAGLAGTSGTNDGTGSAARFNYPSGVAVDDNGNVYVADQLNNTIRKLTPAGVVTTLAGLAGTSGTNDGTGTAALFNDPRGVAVDTNGNVYVADRNNQTVRKVTPAGLVTTLAGLAGFSGNGDGTGTAAQFNSPSGLTVDSVGNVYVADQANNAIRKVTPAGAVSTLAGGNYGTNNGTGTAAQFNFPSSVAVDANGNVYVADTFNNTVRKVTSAREVTTLAGLASVAGAADGTGSAARFNTPSGVAVDTNGNVYVADSYNETVRKVTPGGAVTTLAGQFPGNGSADGTGSAARFNTPSGVAADTNGNVYVADSGNDTIRKVTPAGEVTTLAGLAGLYGTNNGAGSAARFNYPSGVAVDANGNVYVADSQNETIRKVTPAGVVTTLAGLAGTLGTDDGTGSVARFNNPSGVAVDAEGNVYVADSQNDTIRKVTPAGVVTTLAGLAGAPGTNDGTGSAAQFNNPSGVAADTNGNIYVADSYANTIRKVTPAGVVTTLAGPGYYIGADGTGSAAQFDYPAGVAVDTNGNVYVTDSYANTIRKVTPAGAVTTLAGLWGIFGSADGTGVGALFNHPFGVAVDRAGNVYVADANNNTILKGFLNPLVLQATANPSNGIVPMTVQFTSPNTDGAGNAITNWNWVFGDGSTSTLQNPSHTYQTAGYSGGYFYAGYFYPMLTASNNLGSLAGISILTISADLPSVPVTANPTNGLAPLTVQFTAASVDTGGNAITNWNWAFGDGSASALQNPSHTYQQLSIYGPYAPMLTAFNTLGVAVYGTVQLFITVSPNIVQFTANPTVGGIPLSVQFASPNIDGAGHAITNWNWAFGDGSTSTSQNPSHTYQTVGVFQVALIVTNNVGGQISASGPRVTAAAYSGLVLNGGFETGDFSGWTLTDSGLHGFDLVDTFFQSVPEGMEPHSGSYFARLGQSGSLGYLSQTLATTAGGPYLLSFWLNSPDGQTPNSFLASWNGNTLFSRNNLPAFGTSGPALAWTNLHFLVSATASATVLQFDFRDDPTALGLDDVSVLPAQPNLVGLSLSGANLVASGSNGLSGQTYRLLASTNLSLPLSQWSPVATNILGASGNFTLTATNTVNPNHPNTFYVIRLR